MRNINQHLKEYPFTELTDADIAELNAIFKYWYRETCTEDQIASGLYLNDKVDFEKVRQTNYLGQAIGRVYCWEENGRKLAYMLSFDTLDIRGKVQYYLRLVRPFLREDFGFFRRIIYL